MRWLLERPRRKMCSAGVNETGWFTRELSDNGIIGDPRYANLQDGEDILRRMTEKACGALREAAVFQYRSVE